MEAAVCGVCLNSDMLCAACQDRFDKGKVTQKEIDVSRFLFSLSDKVKSLSNVKIVKIMDSGTLIIISKRGDAAKLVGKNGFVVKALAKEFKKSIRVLEECDTLKNFATNLLSPVSLSGVNTLYTPEGEVYKFRISSSFRGRMNLTPESFTDIIQSMYHRKAELIFEQ
jgi:transcription antitermination factor NusA-like protein